MRVRLKVCCIADPAEAKLAIAAGADALGLVGAMPSGPGPIADEVIAEIARRVPPPIDTWLLTSREDGAEIADHVERTGVRTVQIVKHVPPATHAEVRRSGTRIVQVVHVEDEAALDLASRYAESADALLLDSGRPSAQIFGGAGVAHDWAISRRIVEAMPIPVFLAGGLHGGNVAAAIGRVRPFGVDLCSGVRTGGWLDPTKLGAFVRAAT